MFSFLWDSYYYLIVYLFVSLSLSPHRNTGSDGLEKYGQHILDSMEGVSQAPYLIYTARNDDDAVMLVLIYSIASDWVLYCVSSCYC